MKQRVPVEKDPELKIEITRLNKEDPKLTGKEIRASIQKNPAFQGRVPSVRTIQNAVKKNAKRENELNERAQAEMFNPSSSWHTGTLDRCPVPADAIPTIFEIQKKYGTISTRCAKWIGRLSSVVKDEITLLMYASLYAHREEVSEIAGVPFETSNFDEDLRSGIPLGFIQWQISGKWLKDPILNRRFAEVTAHAIENKIVGHSLGEWDVPADTRWWYAWFIAGLLKDVKAGWNSVPERDRELCLLKMREKLPLILPQLLDLLEAHDLDAFVELWREFWGQLKSQKEAHNEGSYSQEV